MCVCALIGDLGSHLSGSQEIILSYIIGQCEQMGICTNTYVKSLLGLAQKVITNKVSLLKNGNAMSFIYTVYNIF